MSKQEACTKLTPSVFVTTHAPKKRKHLSRPRPRPHYTIPHHIPHPHPTVHSPQSILLTRATHDHIKAYQSTYSTSKGGRRREGGEGANKSPNHTSGDQPASQPASQLARPQPAAFQSRQWGGVFRVANAPMAPMTPTTQNPPSRTIEKVGNKASVARPPKKTHQTLVRS